MPNSGRWETLSIELAGYTGYRITTSAGVSCICLFFSSIHPNSFFHIHTLVITPTVLQQRFIAFDKPAHVRLRRSCNTQKLLCTKNYEHLVCTPSLFHGPLIYRRHMHIGSFMHRQHWIGHRRTEFSSNTRQRILYLFFPLSIPFHQHAHIYTAFGLTRLTLSLSHSLISALSCLPALFLFVVPFSILPILQFIAYTGSSQHTLPNTFLPYLFKTTVYTWCIISSTLEKKKSYTHSIVSTRICKEDTSATTTALLDFTIKKDSLSSDFYTTSRSSVTHTHTQH